jgi:hypothetical protein
LGRDAQGSDRDVTMVRVVRVVRVVRESPTLDACPLCGNSPAMPRRATRRQVILSPRPGLFCWR